MPDRGNVGGPAGPLKALSIRQPWAWLLVRPDLTDTASRAAALNAGEIKDVENRSWATKHRGQFLIHAGQTFDMEGYLWVKAHFPRIPLPTPGDYECGGIVGMALITDSIPPERAKHGLVTSRWYMGEHAFLVSAAQPLPFRKVKGKLNFFRPDEGDSPA